MKSLLGLFLGLLVSAALGLLAGENPLHLFGVIVQSAFGSRDDLGMTLFYMTSLTFTGSASAMVFRAGLFSIGAEGQLVFASLFSAVVAPYFLTNTHPLLAFLGCLILSFSFGAMWAVIPAWLKTRREGHEVISTMMMNFIAAGLCTHLVVTYFSNPESQAPETAALTGALDFRNWDPTREIFPGTSFNISFFLAVILCVLLWIFFRFSKFGFKWKVVGLQPEIAHRNAISRNSIWTAALLIGGGLSGLTAMNEIFGSAAKFRVGFSADYGFVGIVVALLARNNPLAVLPSAFLMAMLQKGAGDLALETSFINRDFSKIVQAVILLCLLLVQKPIRWRKNV